MRVLKKAIFYIFIASFGFIAIKFFIAMVYVNEESLRYKNREIGLEMTVKFLIFHHDYLDNDEYWVFEKTLGKDIFRDVYKGIPPSNPWGYGYFVTNNESEFRIIEYGKDGALGGDNENEDFWFRLDKKTRVVTSSSKELEDKYSSLASKDLIEA